MEEFCSLPSLPSSTGKAWESVLPTWHHMRLLQNRVPARGKSSKVEGCVARTWLATWSASGSGFLIWSILTQARAAAPRRASPQYRHPLPETRPQGSFFSPPGDLLSCLSPLINPFLFTRTRIDLSICNQKPWPIHIAHIPFIISIYESGDWKTQGTHKTFHYKSRVVSSQGSNPQSTLPTFPYMYLLINFITSPMQGEENDFCLTNFLSIKSLMTVTWRDIWEQDTVNIAFYTSSSLWRSLQC